MELMHVKLKNGTDLIAFIVKNDLGYVTIKDPVQFGFDPNHGIYGIDWLLLSENTKVELNQSDIFFIQKSSSKAEEFYNQFINKHSTMSEDRHRDLKTVLDALLESRSNVKH
jgi:hypothetical protein